MCTSSSSISIYHSCVLIFLNGFWLNIFLIELLLMHVVYVFMCVYMCVGVGLCVWVYVQNVLEASCRSLTELDLSYAYTSRLGAEVWRKWEEEITEFIWGWVRLNNIGLYLMESDIKSFINLYQNFEWKSTLELGVSVTFITSIE